MKYKTILLVGAPGSGKGTQGVTLGTIPGYYHCACGDVFRSLDTTTEVGQAFLEYSSRGELVPDEITLRLWKAHIKHVSKSHRFNKDMDCLVLDGIPRNVNQARLMEDIITVIHVFHLHCGDRDQLVARLKKRALKDNRFDDAREDVIKNRLETYEAESMPLLQYYPSEKVSTIDALQLPSKVLCDLLQVLNHLDT